MNKNFKLTLGSIYLFCLAILLFILFSYLDMKDLTDYSFIRDKGQLLINLKNDNFLGFSLLFIIASVMLNKKFQVKDINSVHLLALLQTLEDMGANLKINKNTIQIMPSNELIGTKIQTAPYPGFPTDLQAQIMALMSLAKGNSQIKENIFENRFMHVPELNRLGASIRVKKDLAFISGGRKFKGAQVMASDLRASVSLVLAALCAEGTSEVNRVYHLDRGYEKIENTLGKLGPSIKRHKY